MWTELRLQVRGEGGEQLQHGLQGERRARLEVGDQGGHYVTSAEDHLSYNNGYITLDHCQSYLSQGRVSAQFLVQLLKLSTEVHLPPEVEGLGQNARAGVGVNLGKSKGIRPSNISNKLS